MSLAEKILKLRTGQNLSQGELADRLEVSRQSVSKWETGQSVPELEKIVRLADLFGVSVDELVGDGDAPAGAAPERADTPAAEPEAKIIYVERPRRCLTAAQILGVVCAAGGAGLCLISAARADNETFLIGLVVLIAGLPLLLAKKHPWLTLCWVLMALSFVFLRPQQTAWGLVDGLEHLYYYFKLQDPHYSSYAASSDHSYLLFMGIVGIVRGLLTLVLIIFTGRACGKAWKEKRFPEKDG